MRDVLTIAALAVGALVTVVAAIYVGRQRGAQTVQDEATAAQERRTDALANMVDDLEAARKRDRADFDRRLQDSERIVLASERQCESKLSHLQGQLDVLKGGLVRDVGRELAERIRAHDEEFAEHIAVKVADRVKGGAP